MIFLVLFRLVN